MYGEGDSGQMMSFQNALVTCYKKSFTIEGRASRSEYWWFQLHMPAFLFFSIMIDPNGYFMVGIFFLLLFISLPANFCVIVRRWHDLGRSGWHILILLIPWIGWIVTFIYFCMNSSEEGNYYNSAGHIQKKKSVVYGEFNMVSELKNIVDLRDSGILNELEFNTEKDKIKSKYSVEQQQPPPVSMAAQAGRYIKPNTGELLKVEQGPEIDNVASKKSDESHHQVKKHSVTDKKNKGLTKELKKLLSEGLINNAEFKQMKKEILGKN